MRVLAAIDGSASSDAVMQELERRAWSAGTEFRLVTAIDPFFFARTPALMEEAKAGTAKALEEAGAPLVAKGWNVTIEVLIDSPRRALPRYAENWNADLVLVGSHGRGAIGRLLMGSTAQAVLRHSHCSAEVVRVRKDATAPATGRMRILVPTDGSEIAQGALKQAATGPWPKDSEIHVISCPEFPVMVGEEPYYTPEQMVELGKSSEKNSEEAVKAGVEIAKKGGYKVTSEVPEASDTPARAILAAADEWKPDLILMGSHGRSGFDRILLGSVSETVALHAHCSVQVVRPQSKA